MARPNLKRIAQEAKEEGEPVKEETDEKSAPGGDTDDAPKGKKKGAKRRVTIKR